MYIIDDKILILTEIITYIITLKKIDYMTDKRTVTRHGRTWVRTKDTRELYIAPCPSQPPTLTVLYPSTDHSLDCFL